MLTKEEANYRLPDECCATCAHSMLDQYGSPACIKLKTVCMPFPYTQDNNVDLGAKCDQYEKSEVTLDVPKQVYVSPYSDCKFKGTGLCSEECPCDMYNNGEVDKQEEGSVGVLVSCKHYGSGRCDHSCIGCKDYDGPGNSAIMCDASLDDEDEIGSIDEIAETIEEIDVEQYQREVEAEAEYEQPCAHMGSGRCDNNCEGCEDYTAGLDDCIHFSTGNCDMKCEGCNDYTTS